MVDVEEDILVEIPDDDLPKLATLYEKHQGWYPQGYSMINTVMAWKKKSTEKHLTLYSPNTCWKEDGTFFVILKIGNFDLHNIYSLDQSGKNVFDAITKTKRIIIDHPAKLHMFYCVHNHIYRFVMEAIADKELKIMHEDRSDIYSIPNEKALEFDVECSPELYIQKLDQKHTCQVDTAWPMRYKKSDAYVALLIEMNGGYGLFQKSNDELVSWALLSQMGQLTVVQTSQRHLRKGYASLITRFTAREIAKNGHDAVATIHETNVASRTMFEKLGFKNIAPCHYIIFT